MAAAPVTLEAITVPGLGHGIPIKPGAGNEACGEPAPFILDAGISSSFHIAEFFGLVSEKAKADARPAKLKAAAKVVARVVLPRAAPRPEPPPQDAVPHQRRAPIKDVIVKALTAAGLIKKN